MKDSPPPFTLSLSKGEGPLRIPSCFDRLSTNGFARVVL